MSAGRIKVLIVEDDTALREALTDTLSVAGYDVAAAPDAPQPKPAPSSGSGA